VKVLSSASYVHSPPLSILPLSRPYYSALLRILLPSHDGNGWPCWLRATWLEGPFRRRSEATILTGICRQLSASCSKRDNCEYSLPKPSRALAVDMDEGERRKTMKRGRLRTAMPRPDWPVLETTQTRTVPCREQALLAWKRRQLISRLCTV
jgi:hypothetical protein